MDNEAKKMDLLRTAYLLGGPSMMEALQDGQPLVKTLSKNTSRQVSRSVLDVYTPDQTQLDDDWDMYETTPIIQASIDAFAAEVITPGVEVEGSDPSIVEELEEWLDECAVIAGDVEKPFTLLLKAAIIQREVRGTALVEKVRDLRNQDRLYGFKLIPVDTIKHYTLPGQSLLLPPDPEIIRLYGLDPEDYKLTDDGRIAAYVQFDTDILGRRFISNALRKQIETNEERTFARDDILKLVRNPDAGEIFGVSRLKPVRSRVTALKQKLEDNDKAITSMAWKFWLFKFGSEEDPWSPEDIKTFMQSHKTSDFQPGMKQGVQGDVKIDTVEGEVAEGIADFLDFDVNWIISNMPMPKYALGGFEENVNQFVSRSQETRVHQQIREARREIESEFSPVIQEKAEELGATDASSYKIVIKDDELVTDFERPPASSEDSRIEREDQERRREMEQDSIWSEDYLKHHNPDYANADFLNDLPVNEDTAVLEEMAQETLVGLRDAILRRFESQLPSLVERASQGRGGLISFNIENLVDSEIESRLRHRNLSSQSQGAFSSIVKETLLGQSKLANDVNTTFSFTHREMSRGFSDNFRFEVKDAGEQMARTMRTIARNGVENLESERVVRARILDQFTDAKIANRASLIARMQALNAMETTKLRVFEETPSIIGVRVVRDESSDSTPLCSSLAGREVLFENGDIGDQLQGQVSDESLFVGFNPLPSAPPFHFGCSTQLEPIMEGEELADVPFDAEGLPFSGFKDFDECVSKIMEDQDVDKEAARKICGKLQSEEKE